MRPDRSVILGLALVVGTACGKEKRPTSSFPLPGEWPCYRRNASLDAHCPAKGRIGKPAIAWKHFIGVIETTLSVEPADGDQSLSLPVKDAPIDAGVLGDSSWGLRPPEAEIAGRRQPLRHEMFCTYADVLSEAPGLEKIEVYRHEGTVACYAWRGDTWQHVWRTKPMDFGDSVTALPIAGDFDADGQVELAFLPWWNLVVLNARTGQLKYLRKFTGGRNYGYFGAHDLNGNGTREFVVQSDFAKHVDVLGIQDEKLQLLWQRNIELDISNPQKILRVNPGTVTDVDGDGRAELMIDLYNGSNDARWHVTVHDGLTGTVKVDLPDEQLQGVIDVDGDGLAELLTTRAPGRVAPEFGPIRVHSFRGGGHEVVWELADAGWETWSPPLPPNVNSGATYAQRTVLARRTKMGTVAVLRKPTARSDRDAVLSVAKWSERGFKVGTVIRGPRLNGLALDNEGGLLLRCRSVPTTSSSLAVEHGRARVLQGRQIGGAPSTVTVAHPGNERLRVIVAQGAGQELVAFRPPPAKAPELWRLRGRGQSTGWPVTSGPVLADLDGDGNRQLIYATASPRGTARLVAMNLVGTDVWHHDFANIPGTLPVWNSGAVVLWQVGHFTDRLRQDVLVTVRRSMMHSEETVLLSGRDGHELWRRVRQETDMHSRGVGGTPFAIADYDADGLDDVASFYPSQFYIMKGTTGGNLILMNACWDPVPRKPVYWGSAVAGDFEGRGRAGVFMAGGELTALIRPDGSLVWHDALLKSPSTFAFGDVDGDGKVDAIGFGYEDGLRCYESATGRIKWRLPMPTDGAPAGTASGDINSDGRDEVLLTAGRTLYCFGTVRDGMSGELLWQVELPATLGPPSIAQLDDSGGASILVMGDDGCVYCVN